MKGPGRLVIGCGARKATDPAPARDLYVGPLFQAARRYADQSGLPWLIFSARHGLIAPDRVLCPYEQRLNGYDRLLADCLYYSMLDWSGVVEIHMGGEYADFFAAIAERLSLQLVQPLAGMQVGERLAWYKRHRSAA